eukprot:927296-Amorphochlora_amoeboformis.AAC.1
MIQGKVGISNVRSKDRVFESFVGNSLGERGRGNERRVHGWDLLSHPSALPRLSFHPLDPFPILDCVCPDVRKDEEFV